MPTPIQQISTEVPDTYEKADRALALGLDVGWRRKAIHTGEKAA